jgi:hypothetical protein
MNHEPAVKIEAPMLAALWETTKRRVTSYWDAYYRRRAEKLRSYSLAMIMWALRSWSGSKRQLFGNV